jgi:hypothetical protein
LVDKIKLNLDPGTIYYVGITRKNPRSPLETINVNMTGSVCSVSHPVHNGSLCVSVTYLTGQSNTTHVNLTHGEPLYFQYNVSQFATQLNFAVNPPEAVNVYLSYLIAPGNTSVPKPVQNISYPREGSWYAKVELATGKSAILNTTTVTVRADQVTCINSTGWQCSIPIQAPPQVTAYILKDLDPGTWQYYFAPNSPNYTLWVNVVSLGSYAPLVYVSHENIPTADQYDIFGCNVNNCDPSITIINLNNTINPPPYKFVVGVYSVNATKYGIWFDSTCVPGCGEAGYGTCSYSGSTTGLCQCITQYSGIDCQTPPNTLPAQYIVLIIIAALVVASAIIGFIAWAYMQKKRQGYVKVKD